MSLEDAGPDDQTKLREIAEISEKICTPWEQDFIESLLEWEGDFTDKQRDVLSRIYEKACRSPY